MNQAVRDTVAEFIAREAGPQSLITVTRAEVASDFTHADIFLTVLPEDKETAALGLINRSIPELKAFLKSRVLLPRMPHLEFRIDKGEKSAERIFGVH